MRFRIVPPMGLGSWAAFAPTGDGSEMLVMGDVQLTSGGTPVTTDMGFNTWAAWQGLMEEAAVAGDFVMLKEEVAPVIDALVSSGIEVVAVHNYMVHERPRTLFLHYRGTGPADELARGLRAGLDETRYSA